MKKIFRIMFDELNIKKIRMAGDAGWVLLKYSIFKKL